MNKCNRVILLHPFQCLFRTKIRILHQFLLLIFGDGSVYVKSLSFEVLFLYNNLAIKDLYKITVQIICSVSIRTIKDDRNRILVSLYIFNNLFQNNHLSKHRFIGTICFPFYRNRPSINIFANIPYLLTVHHTHKLGGHNCP